MKNISLADWRRVGFRLDDDIHKRLKSYAVANRLTMSLAVNSILDYHFKNVVSGNILDDNNYLYTETSEKKKKGKR